MQGILPKGKSDIFSMGTSTGRTVITDPRAAKRDYSSLTHHFRAPASETISPPPDILSPKLPRVSLNAIYRLPLSDLIPYLLTDLHNALKNTLESQRTSHI